MQKFLAILLTLAVVLGLCACGNEGGGENEAAGGNQSASVTITESQNQSEPEDPDDNRFALDVFSGLTAKVNATINGFGSSIKLDYDYTKVDYDKSNADIKAFLKDIEFYADEYSNLSNGDKFVVHATWSKATAEALGVKLLEESKEYTVDSLYDVYRNASEVPTNLSMIEEIQDAIVEEVERYQREYSWFDSYDISYRYFCAYYNDAAGNPYINQICVTAVVDFTTSEEMMEGSRTETFLGDNSLYQEYWEMRRVASASRSDRVSSDGDLSGNEHTVKVEEFFPN